MLTSDDEELIERCRSLSTQAKDPVPYYQHSTVGYNYRMSNVLAAVGIAQLEALPDRVTRRREIRDIYKKELGISEGISFMPEASWGKSNAWLTVIVVDEKQFGASCEAVRLKLEEHNVESRRVWIPMHKQPVFTKYRCRGGAFSEQLFETGLCLPSGTAMTDEQVEMVAGLIRDTPSR